MFKEKPCWRKARSVFALQSSEFCLLGYPGKRHKALGKEQGQRSPSLREQALDNWGSRWGDGSGVPAFRGKKSWCGGMGRPPGPLGEQEGRQGLGLWRQKFTNKMSGRFQEALGQMLLRGLMSCPGSREADTGESLGEKRVEKF